MLKPAKHFKNMKPYLNWYSQILLFIVSFAIVVHRRPDALLNPQFWAEDGTIWYATAYNEGVIHSLFLPQNGYFQTISRLIAAFTQFFPLSWAPLIFNIVAIIIKVLPVSLMMSYRFSTLIPSLKTRILLSFIYLALPNSWEIHANLTNAQWHLAILAFMVAIAMQSNHFLWRCFDVGIILLSGLSGPFSIMLTPIAAIRWWLYRNKWLFTLLLLIGICALIQTTCIFLTAQDTRSEMSLGATPELFIRILSGQIFLGSLIGQKGYQWMISSTGWYNLFALFVNVFGIIALMYALLKAPTELRLFIIFATLIFSMALITPQANATMPQWLALSLPGVGGRYWFIPMLAFITILIWMMRRQSSYKLRGLFILAFSIIAIGIILDWQHPPFTDFNFKEYSNQFAALPEGNHFTIPINPPGWSMTLIKH